SIAGIFIKLIPWNGLVIAGWRSLLSSLCVIVYMRRTGLKFKWDKHSVSSGAFMMLVFLGFVSANKLTTAANAIVLQYTAPVFILVISALFLKQKFSRADILAVLLTLCGISLFFFDQLSPGNMLGNCVAIGAGLAMACMFIIGGNAGEES
ncbi:MAG: DMT family transporter, partial [Pygmaiobacter sp.]